jgi:hypothetical protein
LRQANRKAKKYVAVVNVGEAEKECLRSSSKISKRKNPVGLILRAAVNSMKAAKTPPGFYFRRIPSKNGYCGNG